MSAMNAAPRSSRVVTNRIEESASASMTWRFSSPGRPNTYSTPSFSRHATRSCATFRSCCDDMRGSLPLPGTRSRDSVRRDGGSTGPPRHPQTVRAARGRVVALDRRRRRGRPRRDRRRPQHPGSRRRGAAYLIVRGHGDRAVGGRDRDRGVRGARSGDDMARRDRARRRLRGDRDREVRHGAHRLVSGEPQRTDPERRWSDLGRHGRTDRGGRCWGGMVRLVGVGVGVLYIAAIWIFAVMFRPAEPPDGPSVTVAVGLTALGIAATIATSIVMSAAAGQYVEFAITGLEAGGIALALFVAACLVAVAFRGTAVRSKALGQVSMYISVLWVAIAFLVVFQVLWIVFLLAIVAIWPFKSVTPK